MLFVAVYIISVGIVLGYAFIQLCKKNWEIPASIIVVVMFLLAFIFITPVGAEELPEDMYYKVALSF